MESEQEEESEHYIELIKLRTERLKNLEIIQARYGIDTKPEIMAEIIKLRNEIDDSKRIITINRKYVNKTHGVKKYHLW